MAANISEVIDREGISGLQVGVLLLTSLAIVVDGFDIQALGFAAPVIIEEWGITRAEFGPASAAALGGMLLGAPIGGALGDAIGRRLAMVLSALFFGFATIGAAFVTDLNSLIVVRLVSGIGFGAMLPNATALLSEWMPARHRSLSISVMIIGVPIGGMIGAAVASWLIPAFGWRACFLLGGAIALTTAAILFLLLPESLRYLAQRPNGDAALKRLLGKAYGKGKFDRQTFTADAGAQAGVGELFAGRHLRVTTGLVIAFIANLLVYYGFASWIPTMLTSMGMPLDVSIRGSFYLNLWGLPGAIVAGFIVGWLGSRRGLLFVLASSILFTAGMAYLVIGGDATSTAVMIGLSAIGAANAGLQAGLYALAAAAYPTRCRSSGIGVVAGLGRVGAIVSAFAGGLVLSLSHGEAWFFAIVTGVLVIAVLGVLLVDRHSPPTGKRRTKQAVEPAAP